MRRWWGVIALTVIALTVYLVSPDRVPEQIGSPPPPTVGSTAVSDGSHHPSDHPPLSSDGVTVQPRSADGLTGASHASALPTNTTLATTNVAESFHADRARHSTPDTRPDLTVLQRFRC